MIMAQSVCYSLATSDAIGRYHTEALKFADGLAPDPPTHYNGLGCGFRR